MDVIFKGGKPVEVNGMAVEKVTEADPPAMGDVVITVFEGLSSCKVDVAVYAGICNHGLWLSHFPMFKSLDLVVKFPYLHRMFREQEDMWRDMYRFKNRARLKLTGEQKETYYKVMKEVAFRNEIEDLGE